VVCCCCPCGPGRSIGCLGGPDDASSLDQEGVREISRRDTGVLSELACLRSRTAYSDVSKDNVPATRDEIQYWAEAGE